MKSACRCSMSRAGRICSYPPCRSMVAARRMHRCSGISRPTHAVVPSRWISFFQKKKCYRAVRYIWWQMAIKTIIRCPRLLPSLGAAPTHQMVALIGKLYQIKRVARDKTPQERQAIRRKKATPIPGKIKTWLDQSTSGVAQASPG